MLRRIKVSAALHSFIRQRLAHPCKKCSKATKNNEAKVGQLENHFLLRKIYESACMSCCKIRVYVDKRLVLKLRTRVTLHNTIYGYHTNITLYDKK